MGRIEVPISNLEGKLIDNWYTLLPREGKKDAVSGKIRLQTYLKVLLIFDCIYWIVLRITLQILGEDNIKNTKAEARFEDKVDSSSLKKLDESTLKAQKILFELIESETHYVNDLDHLLTVRFNNIYYIDYY